MKPSFDDPYRLITDYAKNYCNRARALIVKVIVQNVIRFFSGHSVVLLKQAYIIQMIRFLKSSYPNVGLLCYKFEPFSKRLLLAI